MFLMGLGLDEVVEGATKLRLGSDEMGERQVRAMWWQRAGQRERERETERNKSRYVVDNPGRTLGQICLGFSDSLITPHDWHRSLKLKTSVLLLVSLVSRCSVMVSVPVVLTLSFQQNAIHVTRIYQMTTQERVYWTTNVWIRRSCYDQKN